MGVESIRVGNESMSFNRFAQQITNREKWYHKELRKQSHEFDSFNDMFGGKTMYVSLLDMRNRKNILLPNDVTRKSFY